MEKKDDRSKGKRKAMKVWKGKGGRKNTSGGVVDVADSSDDRFVNGGGGSGWITGMQPQHQPSMPDDDDDLGDEVANAQLRAGDFEAMSQLPKAIGGHFQFSTEKQWDATEPLYNAEAGEYFTLNLKLLNAGLQTIPFYKRMEYATSMFTPTQVIKMNEAAEAAEQRYQNILSEHEQRLNKQNSAGSKKSQATVKAAVATKDELDDLLDMTAKVALTSNVGNENVPPVTPSIAAATPTTSNEKGDDIQQWLDNVLEED